MLKLNIQYFGGRGASSGGEKGGRRSKEVRKTWTNKYVERIANVMSQLGITQKQYEENISVGNRLYMSIIGEISDNYEKQTGRVGFGATKEFENFVKNYNINGYVKNNSIAKEYLLRLRKGK